MSTLHPHEHRRPALRIVRGDPSPEELAAIVTVLAAAGSVALPGEQGGMRPVVSRWAAPDLLVRRPLEPNGWWASSLPR